MTDALLKPLAPVIGTADRGSRIAGRVALVSLLSAACLVGVPIVLLWPPGPLLSVVFVVLAAVALAPAAVIGLFGYGLASLARIPADLVSTARSAATAELPPSRLPGPIGTLWRLARYLLAGKETLFALKGRLIEAGLMLRMVHPASLIAVMVSLVATAVMVPSAALLVLLALVFG